MLYWLARGILAVICRIFFRIKVEGIDNLPRKGGCVVASNHVSFLDPVILGAVSPRQFNYLARESLFRNKIFGRFLRAVGTIPLRREKVGPRTVKEALRRIAKGEVLVLFPEGTRSPDTSLMKGKAGVAFLAVKAKVPVIPVYLSGTERGLPRDAHFIRPARIRVAFGKRIAPAEFFPPAGKDYDYQQAADLVMERIAYLKVKEEKA